MEGSGIIVRLTKGDEQEIAEHELVLDSDSEKSCTIPVWLQEVGAYLGLSTNMTWFTEFLMAFPHYIAQFKKKEAWTFNSVDDLVHPHTSS